MLPVPTPSAHPEGLPGWDATDAPSPTAPEGAPEEPGTAAEGTTAVPTPGTSAPPCPGDEEPAEACGEPAGEQRAAVAEALGTFALRFYQHMAAAAQPDANLLFSPINVAAGLSHLLLGEGLPAGTGTAVSPPCRRCPRRGGSLSFPCARRRPRRDPGASGRPPGVPAGAGLRARRLAAAGQRARPLLGRPNLPPPR